MNIQHYRDNCDTWLYYRDGRIFIIAQPYSERQNNLLLGDVTTNYWYIFTMFKQLQRYNITSMV